MKKLLTLLSVFALTATVAAADTGQGRKDLQVFNDISKAVTRYAQFTIFDSVDASLKTASSRLPDESRCRTR